MNLSSTIKSIQDIMRKDDGVDGDAQRIGQLTWMLFLKIYDQKEDEWKKKKLILNQLFQKNVDGEIGLRIILIIKKKKNSKYLQINW